VVGLWSVVSVHKVVLTLDHLPSLSFLSLYLFQSWEAQLLCPHPGNWEKYWTELGAVAVGAHCEGFLVGVWSPQGLVSCSWDTMPACHGPECFAKEIEWRKRLWRTDHFSWSTDVPMEVLASDLWASWKCSEPPWALVSEYSDPWLLKSIIQTQRCLSGADAKLGRMLGQGL